MVSCQCFRPEHWLPGNGRGVSGLPATDVLGRPGAYLGYDDQGGPTTSRQGCLATAVRKACASLDGWGNREMSSQFPNTSAARQVVIAVAAGLILAAMLGLIGFIWHKSSHGAQGGGSAAGSASPRHPATSARAPASSSPATVISSPSPGQTSASVAPPVPAAPAAQYLADLTPLPDESPVTEPEQMGGIFYAHAVSTSSGGWRGISRTPSAM